MPDTSELEAVMRYHERTKHHFNRFAAGPGQLDWANQPDPFRRFEGAAQVSCRQAIAGEGAFSLGMVAEYQENLVANGPWFYRRLFREAGAIGQVLYLEAEAAGVRATGIGCFFDDPVHQVFGLSGLAFQSLYHFTVGGAVDDPRLTTLPAYGARLEDLQLEPYRLQQAYTDSRTKEVDHETQDHAQRDVEGDDRRPARGRGGGPRPRGAGGG